MDNIDREYTMTFLNKRSEIVFALVFLLMVSLPLYAGDEDRIGTAAGVQVQQPVSARSLAMAGANIVYTKGIDALYWNPAGLSNMDSGFEGAFTRNTVFNDIGINYLGLGVNMGNFGAIGFDIKTFDFGDIPMTTVEDMDGSSGATFSPTWATLGLTYANKLTSSIQVGLKAKVLYESVPRVSGTAFAFDLGIQYKDLAGIQGVSFAVVMKNIGTDMKYDGSGMYEKTQDDVSGGTYYFKKEASGDQLPAALEIGLSYNMAINEQNGVLLSGVFQNNNVENDAFRFGVEYNFNNFVALRGGYLYTAKTDADNLLYTFTLGAGIQYKIAGSMVGIDYAFRDSRYFNANNMFTLRVGL